MDISWRLMEAGYCLHPEASSRMGASWRPCEFPALVALLRHPHRGWILFDTGYGQAFMKATQTLPEAAYRWMTPVRWREEHSVAAQLFSDGINPGDIAHVLVSHFHGDHVGALSDFGAADVWCSQVAWEDLHGKSRLQALLKGLLPSLAPQSLAGRLTFYEHCAVARLPAELAPFGYSFDIFGDDSLYAVALPGHAPGHFGVCFRSQGQWVFLVGDAAWSVRAIQENSPPPRWATSFLGDTAAYRGTLASLHSLWARATGVTLVPSHCRSRRP
jgi:glyoxylase-like metal-dependent hydrolase (beta-lactamase superfamily II)